MVRHVLNAIIAGVLLLLAAAASAAEPSATYVVRFEEHDRRLAFVEATILTNEEILLMYPDGAEHLPNGWSTYLRHFAARDGDGNPIVLESGGRDRWKTGAMRGRELHLRYEVLIHHDAGRWPFGWDEAAYVKGDSVFLTGKALFVTAFDLSSITVTFGLPVGWQIATPWTPSGDRSFRVETPVELTEVALMTGRFEERTARSGAMTVRLVTGAGLRDALPLFDDAVRKVLPIADRVFGGTPMGTFLIAANREEAFTGGGTFPRSISMLFQDVPSASNAAEWSHVIVHELLHLWLGGAMQMPAAEESWFAEGVADYLASLIRLRAALIDEAQFRMEVAQHAANMDKVTSRLSLHAAGRNKAENYDLVYSGGYLAALALDVELRRGGGEGLPGLLRQMYSAAEGRVFDTAAIAGVAASRSPGGAKFFERYVQGTERIDVARVLKEAGMTLVRTGSEVRIEPDPSGRGQELRRALLYGK